MWICLGDSLLRRRSAGDGERRWRESWPLEGQGPRGRGPQAQERGPQAQERKRKRKQERKRKCSWAKSLESRGVLDLQSRLCQRQTQGEVQGYSGRPGCGTAGSGAARPLSLGGRWADVGWRPWRSEARMADDMPQGACRGLAGHQDGPCVRARPPPFRALQLFAACRISPTFTKLRSSRLPSPLEPPVSRLLQQQRPSFPRSRSHVITFLHLSPLVCFLHSRFHAFCLGLGKEL